MEQLKLRIVIVLFSVAYLFVKLLQRSRGKEYGFIQEIQDEPGCILGR
jgi:hypothetical protein